MNDFVDQAGLHRTDPTQTLQSGATATGNGTSMVVRAMQGIMLHVTGITTATLIIQGTDANSNTSTLTVKDVNTGASATSITTNGFYVVAFEGLSTINAIIQSYTSGTITVTGAPANVTVNGGSGGTSTVSDGGDTVEGSTTDAANTTGATGTISGKLRGLSKILGDVWDSVNHWLQVTEMRQPQYEDNTNAVAATSYKPLSGTTYSAPIAIPAFGSGSVAISVKATPGNLLGFHVFNKNTSLRYIQLFNKTSVPVTSDVPIYSIPISAGSATAPANTQVNRAMFGDGGKYFSTGIAFGISTTEATYTAATAADHDVYIEAV